MVTISNHRSDYGEMKKNWNKFQEKLIKNNGKIDLLECDITVPPTWSKENYIKQTQEERWGKEYINYRDLLEACFKQEIELNYPLQIDVDVQDVCNIVCESCSENYRVRDSSILDLELFKSNPFFQKGKLKAVNIGNASEPFVRPKMVTDLIRFFRENGVVDIFIHTNAHFLNDNIMEELIDLEVNWMLFSIDALTEETYSKVRGINHTKVYTNIHRFLELRDKKKSKFPLTHVSFINTIENYHEINDFHNYWKQYVERVLFQGFVGANPIGTNVLPHVAFTDRFVNIKMSTCNMPWYRMFVMPNGNVGPCCMTYGQEPDLILGNLKEKTPLDEMWQRKIQYIRKQLKCSNGSLELPTCKQCLTQFYTGIRSPTLTRV